jgi:predicted ATPase with chaperone activity
MLVPTVDTARTKFVVGALALAGHHALVIGAAGVGKTMTLASLLEGLPAGTAHATINFSAQTSSVGLQVGVCRAVDGARKPNSAASGCQRPGPTDSSIGVPVPPNQPTAG